MTPVSDSAVRYVDATIIRDLFNEGKYYERALSGDLTVRLARDNTPDPPPKGQPVGTQSQILYYYEAGEPVAVVHQYLRPDGTLGGSGRPDPKELRIDGVRIILWPHH